MPWGKLLGEKLLGKKLLGLKRRRWCRAFVIIGAIVVASVPVGIVASEQLTPVAASSIASRSGSPADPPAAATSGGWAKLLSLSTDLGPARVGSIDVMVTLGSARRPERLQAWAGRHHLVVTWYAGEQFAVVTGPAASVGSAFGVAIDSYRSRHGELFYSAIRQPSVPAQLSPGVTGIGSINNYGRLTTQLATHDFVPNGGLTPQGLLEAYEATPLSDSVQGQGETVVFLEGSPVEQSDLDAFTQKFSLPQIQLQIVGGDTSGGASESGEADMDIETVHEIAPQAKLVYFNITSAPGITNSTDIGAAMALSISAIAREFPGAVISASLGICERTTNKRGRAGAEQRSSRRRSDGRNGVRVERRHRRRGLWELRSRLAHLRRGGADPGCGSECDRCRRDDVERHDER